MLDSNQIAEIPSKIQEAWGMVCSNFFDSRLGDKDTILAELYHQIRIVFNDEYNDRLIDIMTDYSILENKVHIDIIVFSRNEDITIMPSEDVDSNGVYAVINLRFSVGGESDEEFLKRGLHDLEAFSDMSSPTDEIDINVSLPSQERVAPYFKYFLGINNNHRTENTFISMQKAKDDEEFEELDAFLFSI